MQSSLLTDGTLVEVDDKRVYNASQKYELWRKQNGICPLSGKTIPLYEILDSSKWQGDHILEYSKGGKTSVDNGQLICVTAHKQKTKDFMKAS
jgi:5-methylcytosine-specific restriction endonuclease McrA